MANGSEREVGQRDTALSATRIFDLSIASTDRALRCGRLGGCLLCCEFGVHVSTHSAGGVFYICAVRLRHPPFSADLIEAQGANAQPTLVKGEDFAKAPRETEKVAERWAPEARSWHVSDGRNSSRGRRTCLLDGRLHKLLVSTRSSTGLRGRTYLYIHHDKTA